MNIGIYIDHTVLKPDTILSDIEAVCNAAVEYKLTTVCVPPMFVKNVRKLAESSGIKVATVVGFPFGYAAIEAKIAEVVLAVIDGADEIEMVINTSAVKNNDWQFLANEINTVMPIIRGKGKQITVILETSLMTDTEIITACDVYGAAGVDFVKVGTGFFENELILEHLRLIRKHLAGAVQLKTGIVAGNYVAAMNLIKAGANRLSCINSLKLIKEALQQN